MLHLLTFLPTSISTIFFASTGTDKHIPWGALTFSRVWCMIIWSGQFCYQIPASLLKFKIELCVATDYARNMSWFMSSKLNTMKICLLVSNTLGIALVVNRFKIFWMYVYALVNTHKIEYFIHFYVSCSTKEDKYNINF